MSRWCLRRRGERFPDPFTSERRYQAAVKVGLKELPQRDFSKCGRHRGIMEIALVQRKDLHGLRDTQSAPPPSSTNCGYTRERMLARRLGKSRTAVADPLS